MNTKPFVSGVMPWNVTDQSKDWESTGLPTISPLLAKILNQQGPAILYGEAARIRAKEFQVAFLWEIQSIVIEKMPFLMSQTKKPGFPDAYQPSQWNFELLSKELPTYLTRDAYERDVFDEKLVIAKLDGSLWSDQWKRIRDRIDIHWSEPTFQQHSDNLLMIEKERSWVGRAGFPEWVHAQIDFLSRIHRLCYPQFHVHDPVKDIIASLRSTGKWEDPTTWWIL